MDLNRQQRGVPQNVVPVGGFRQGTVPTVERGIIIGDNVQFGRLRRRSNLSQSESSGAEEERLGSSMEASGSYGRSPILQGMQAEGVWYNRTAYEQAEGNYHRQLASSGNGPLSSSPRSPNTKGTLTFHSSFNSDQQQDEGHAVMTVKASGTPHRRLGKGRNRTSSETEEGGKGSRGPNQRKRGLSKTESRPKWVKYDTSRNENDHNMICVVTLVTFVCLHCLFFRNANLCIHFFYFFFWWMSFFLKL
ncbi:hypothetical protein AMECASPLE_021245 [Ameca splendens]|uniref:Uncharacterized protein n=1 Tax=Ameca splendens TaxID=208324 RepID=A0ABV0XGI6_9TELE